MIEFIKKELDKTVTIGQIWQFALMMCLIRIVLWIFEK
jgi:hypothetical protein